MKLNSTVEIIAGKLQNTPAISFFYNYQNDPKKVKEGDLFFAKNKNDLYEAIQNGAFGVVYDFNVDITDVEIAWIKVLSVMDSIIRLARYELSQFELNFFYTDQTTFDLLKIYKGASENIFLIENIEDVLRLPKKVESGSYIFSSDKNISMKLYPEAKKFANTDWEINNLINHTLFETSFSVGEFYFSRIKLAQLYIKRYLDIFSFFKVEFDIDIDSAKLKRFKHFRPIFIDKFLNISDFGSTSRFILAEKDFSLAKQQINFLEENYRYGKKLYITSKNFTKLYANQYIYESTEEILHYLNIENYNCILIEGISFDEVNELLSMRDINTLF